MDSQYPVYREYVTGLSTISMDTEIHGGGLTGPPRRDQKHLPVTSGRWSVLRSREAECSVPIPQKVFEHDWKSLVQTRSTFLLCLEGPEMLSSHMLETHHY